MYDVDIAEKVGLNSAIILNRIVWSINSHVKKNDKRYFIEGKWWMFSSVREFVTATGLGTKAVSNGLKKLKEAGLILVAQHGYYNRSNFYTVHREKLAAITPKGTNDPKRHYAPGDLALTPKGVMDTPKGVDVITPKGINQSKKESTKSTTIILPPEKSDCSESKQKQASPKKKSGRSKAAPPSPEFLRLGGLWLEHAKANSKTKPPASWTALKFAVELQRVSRVTGVGLERLESILGFLGGDEFWRPNAISPFTLDKKSKSNGLRKIENIITAMEKPKGGNYGKSTTGPKRQHEYDHSWDNPKYSKFSDDKPF